MKFCFILCVCVFIVNCVKSAPVVDRNDGVIEYLQTFGYLPESKNTMKISRKQLRHALKRLQIDGHIEVTEEIDDNTLKLMKAPRCGSRDIFRNHRRQKRYDLLSTKWDKHHITWTFDHKHSKYIHNASRIRNLVAETLDIWSKNSLLKFEEVELPESADIIVSFEKVFHPDVDAFAMNDPVLAHAFRPGSGIGGDVHFREDLEWNFEVSYGDQPTDGALSFFSAALHELGHTLGLGHSDKSDAVMYDFYTKSTGILSLDDINGIHHIYGIPPHYNEPTTARPVDTEGHTDFVFPEPDKCDTSYDAIATIRNELFIFKGRYMWRPNSSNDTIEIRKMWSELPENLTYVDAVIENDDGKVLFFIGKDIYGFVGTKFEFKSSLSQLGIDHHFNKIDAIFKWHYNKQTYIFSGTQYWKLDGKMVNRQYPKDILRSWRDVYDIDTAYGTSDKLYFFKGTFFHEFNYRTMRMERMNPQKSAQTFMKCAERPSGIPPRFGDHGDEVLDNGMIEEVLDDENFEKMETFTSNVNETTTPDAAATHNLLVSILLASLAISQVLQSISLYF